MGNPHPTRSKPCKIGRKHTGAKSLRHIGRLNRVRLKREKIKALKFKEFKKEVAKYFRGERDDYPKKPSNDQISTDMKSPLPSGGHSQNL